MMYTNLWYVAESSSVVADQPVRVRMLGRDFVLFRDDVNQVACLSDVCPHRGSSLSRGKCQGDGTVSCPFHGWRFDRHGSCSKIPSQQNPDGDIPHGAKIDAYPVEEKYGLIWVFLGDDVENALPIIDIPEIESDDWRHAHYSDVWHANQHWSKMTDLDHVHLPIVHGIDFGGDNPFRPPDHKVEMANAESIMPKRAPDLDDWPLVRADREDRLISAYWNILRKLRNEGRQIDRVKLDEMDRNGDYRVIPSPARKQGPDGWVFDTVPTIAAGEATGAKQELESVQLGAA